VAISGDKNRLCFEKKQQKEYLAGEEEAMVERRSTNANYYYFLNIETYTLITSRVTEF